MSPIRVVVADATLMTCGLVSAGLKRHSQFEVVGFAASADELFRLVEHARPDVALISATLQNQPFSGLAVVSQIRGKYPNTRLIVLIDRAEPEVVVQAFRAGARGVFSRSESQFGLLCRCVFYVHQGQIWANTPQLEFLLDALVQLPSVRVVDSDGANLLTKREEDLVRLVADGLSNRDIAGQLNLSEHTVKNYVFRIFDKLGVSNRVELALYALTNGKGAEISASSDNAPQRVAPHSHVSALSLGNKVR
jgi:DNA-binding NarL/FixJ family response regulator